MTTRNEDAAYDDMRDQELERRPDELRIEFRMRAEAEQRGFDECMAFDAMEAMYEAIDNGAAF